MILSKMIEKFADQGLTLEKVLKVFPELTNDTEIDRSIQGKIRYACGLQTAPNKKEIVEDSETKSEIIEDSETKSEILKDVAKTAVVVASIVTPATVAKYKAMLAAEDFITWLFTAKLPNK